MIRLEQERKNAAVEEKEHLAQYLSDISHQLKTPVTSMMLMADYTSNYENRINPETGRRESHYVQTIDNVLAEKITEELEGTREAGFVCRVFGAQDFAKIMNIAVVLAFFFLYGFVFLLGLIGILNVISTEIFHIRMRAREFAVLQSVGMTSESLRKMLNLESVFCAGRALVTGLPVGMIIVWLMKYCVQRILPIPFQMPWGMIIGVAAVSFAAVWATARISLYALKGQNLIETIRMQR